MGAPGSDPGQNMKVLAKRGPWTVLPGSQATTTNSTRRHDAVIHIQSNPS